MLKPGGFGQQTIQLKVVRAKLATGDYALMGYEKLSLVERKGSITELYQNCLTKDKVRFEACLKRLSEESADPWVLVEGSPSSLFKPNRHLPVEPGTVIDGLQRLLMAYNVGLLLMPAKSAGERRAAGEWVARRLINRALFQDLHPTHGDSQTIPRPTE